MAACLHRGSASGHRTNTHCLLVNFQVAAASHEWTSSPLLSLRPWFPWSAHAWPVMRAFVGAGFDPGVVLMRNTPEVRAFWRAAQETLQDTALMAEVR